MKRKIAYLVLSFLSALSLVLASCTSTVTDEEKSESRNEQKEVEETTPAQIPTPSPLTPALVKTIEIFPWGVGSYSCKPVAVDDECLYVGQERSIQIFNKGDWKLVDSIEMKEGADQILVDNTRIYSTPRGIYSDPNTVTSPTEGIRVFDKSTGDKLMELEKVEEVGGVHYLGGGAGIIAIDNMYFYELRGNHLLLRDKRSGTFVKAVALKEGEDEMETFSVSFGGYRDMEINDENIYFGIELAELQIWDKATMSMIKGVQFYESGAREGPGFNDLAIDDNYVYFCMTGTGADDFQVLSKSGESVTSLDEQAYCVYSDNINIYLGRPNWVNIYDVEYLKNTGYFFRKGMLDCPAIPRLILADEDYIYILSDYVTSSGEVLDHATLQIWEK